MVLRGLALEPIRIAPLERPGERFSCITQSYGTETQT